MATTIAAAVAQQLLGSEEGTQIMFALIYTVAVLATIGGFAAMFWASNRTRRR